MDSFFSCGWLRTKQYIDEPAETKNPGALRAQVQAVYYPPQEFKNDRTLVLPEKIQRDNNFDNTA